MLTLTVEGARSTILAAYVARKLSAQSDNPVCEYRAGGTVDGPPCAIGACIPDDVWTELVADRFNRNGVGALGSHGVISAGPATRDWLQTVQSRHDEWAGKVRDVLAGSTCPQDTTDYVDRARVAEADFLTVLFANP